MTTDPWTIHLAGVQPEVEAGCEARLAIGNGYLGSPGAVEEGAPFAHPGTFIRGVFDRDWLSAVPPLDASEAPAPITGIDPWSLRVELDGVPVELAHGEVLSHERELALREGVLRRRWRHRIASGRVVRIETERRALLDRPHALLHVVRVTAEDPGVEVRVRLAVDATRPLDATQLAGIDVEGAIDGEVSRVLVVGRRQRGESLQIAAAQACTGTSPAAPMRRSLDPAPGSGACVFEWRASAGETVEFVRRTAIATTRDAPEPDREAARLLAALEQVPVADLASSHARRWDERWTESGVDIEGDDASNRALRFATYHLIASAGLVTMPALLGARGLTGDGYLGHAFWDTEIYVLPFLVLTRPEVARALLLGRVAGLGPAREKAASQGFDGALYAWEVASSGHETTPQKGRGPNGEPVELATSHEAHHVSADVAHMVWTYWRASGDDAFFAGAGARVLLETARFWASRVEADGEGRHHIRRVIGPDEYHPHVDDDAYTNTMAARNLRLGARTRRWSNDDDAEARRWCAIAETLVDGAGAPERPTEQFAGYFGLEDVTPRELGAIGQSLERQLGLERIARSQLVKQPSVVMLGALLGDERDPGRTRRDFAYYEPRCNYASSLAAPMHALVAARLGDERRFLELLRRTMDIDVGSDAARSAGGVHLAALGGAWLAVVAGAAGLAIEDDALRVEPRLPSSWSALRFACRWRGCGLRFEVRPGALTLTVDAAVPPLWASASGSVAALRPGAPVTFARTCVRIHASRPTA